MLGDEAAFAEPGVKAMKIRISLPVFLIFLHAGRLVGVAVSTPSVAVTADVRDKPGWAVDTRTAG